MPATDSHRDGRLTARALHVQAAAAVLGFWLGLTAFVVPAVAGVGTGTLAFGSYAVAVAAAVVVLTTGGNDCDG